MTCGIPSRPGIDRPERPPMSFSGSEVGRPARWSSGTHTSRLTRSRERPAALTHSCIRTPIRGADGGRVGVPEVFAAARLHEDNPLALGSENKPAVPMTASIADARYAPVPEVGGQFAQGLSATGVPMPSSTSRIQRSRLLAFKAQCGRCCYCNQPMWMQSPSELSHIPKKHAARLQCTAEHLTPRSNRGKHTPDNIAAACLFCNQHRPLVRPTPVVSGLMCKSACQRVAVMARG